MCQILNGLINNEIYGFAKYSFGSLKCESKPHDVFADTVLWEQLVCLTLLSQVPGPDRGSQSQEHELEEVISKNWRRSCIQDAARFIVFHGFIIS